MVYATSFKVNVFPVLFDLAGNQSERGLAVYDVKQAK